MKSGQISLIVAEPLQFRDFEAQNYARGFRFVAGIDEAGRGPLAGPVVAAAVVLPRGFTPRRNQRLEIAVGGAAGKIVAADPAGSRLLGIGCGGSRRDRQD